MHNARNLLLYDILSDLQVARSLPCPSPNAHTGSGIRKPGNANSVTRDSMEENT